MIFSRVWFRGIAKGREGVVGCAWWQGQTPHTAHGSLLLCLSLNRLLNKNRFSFWFRTCTFKMNFLFTSGIHYLAYFSISFEKSVDPVNTTTIKLPSGFITPSPPITSGHPFVFKPFPIFNLLQPLIGCLSLKLCFSRVPRKWNYTVWSLLRLASLTLPSAFGLFCIVACNNSVQGWIVRPSSAPFLKSSP